jgi:hypothetical protein
MTGCTREGGLGDETARRAADEQSERARSEEAGLPSAWTVLSELVTRFEDLELRLERLEARRRRTRPSGRAAEAGEDCGLFFIE